MVFSIIDIIFIKKLLILMFKEYYMHYYSYRIMTNELLINIR